VADLDLTILRHLYATGGDLTAGEIADALRFRVDIGAALSDAHRLVGSDVEQPALPRATKAAVGRALKGMAEAEPRPLVRQDEPGRDRPWRITLDGRKVVIDTAIALRDEREAQGEDDRG
jgi:hypothetical protein